MSQKSHNQNPAILEEEWSFVQEYRALVADLVMCLLMATF